jgi:hypothetical protein
MAVRSSVVCFVALVGFACQTEPPTRDPEAGDPPPAGMVEMSRHTSDGERVRVYVPQAPAMLEVQEGSPCGVQNADGAFLSCRPGTSCVSPAEGVAGTCQAAAAGPRWDG